ncbi:MAG: hypothetical protein M1828_003076 [Chrysothrix sp. TS-e1954]|nr:MAG: hypothetical protein M1828_003076 [Chrysothrix sp. TS-e1954]
MATATKIVLTGAEKPVYGDGPFSKEAAETASRLLQDNHDNHHIFFSPNGFHNHRAHHLFTQYALHATADQIQFSYDHNKGTMRAIGSIDQDLLNALRAPDNHSAFASALNKEQNYATFLRFFELEIDEKSWPAVLQEYLFKGDERADDLLARTYGGFLHPLIHLGFGIEFEQPAVIAEALAQAALHADYLKPVFAGCESKAAAREAGGQKAARIPELLDAIRADEKLRVAAHWEDDNKLRDGVIARAADEMIDIASRWSVGGTDQASLDAGCREMYDATVYYTSTSQHPPSIPKYDFYYMHAVNSSIFFPRLLSLPTTTLSQPSKTRLLNYKVWNDLALYASRRAPALLLDEVRHYAPQKQAQSSWADVIRRVNAFEDDDSHACKLIRAIGGGEAFCHSNQGQGSVTEQGRAGMMQGDAWWRAANMAIDSVEAPGKRWVRSAGFEEAWVDVPARL